MKVEFKPTTETLASEVLEGYKQLIGVKEYIKTSIKKTTILRNLQYILSTLILSCALLSIWSESSTTTLFIISFIASIFCIFRLNIHLEIYNEDLVEVNIAIDKVERMAKELADKS